MPTTWKFVDTPTSSPAVLLDMNNGGTWKTLGGEFFDVSPPPLKRSIVSNAMNDGGLQTAAAYELRELKFTIEMTGATEADRNTQLTQLGAELAKPTNLIMYQPVDGTNPVFFRTLRSDDYRANRQFIPGKAWRVECSVLAEPFAIGIRRDLSQVTVTNNPASVTNPARWDITGIVGDSPTPAFLRISDLGASGILFLAQRTANNPTALTHFAQAESGTMGTDTSVVANDALFSGAGSNKVTTTFSTSTSLVTRMTLNIPTASSSEALRGRYRVILRGQRGTSGAEFNMRFRVPGTDVVVGPTNNSTGTNTSLQHFDLGVVEFPSVTAAPTTIGYSGLTAGYAQPQAEIQIQRVSGSGSFHSDYVYLLPADERCCAVAQIAASGFLILDGPNDATYAMASGTTAFGSTRTVDNAGGLVPRVGGLPMLVPGVTNRMYMLTQGSVTSTETVDVSYWPRWREVATS